MVHVSWGRNLNKSNGGLEAALYYADMMINACAGHNRLTFNLHLCKQPEPRPAGSVSTGA